MIIKAVTKEELKTVLETYRKHMADPYEFWTDFIKLEMLYREPFFSNKRFREKYENLVADVDKFMDTYPTDDEDADDAKMTVLEHRGMSLILKAFAPYLPVYLEIDSYYRFDTDTQRSELGIEFENDVVCDQRIDERLHRILDVHHVS